MTNWATKQRTCKRCYGTGYVESLSRPADGSGRPARVYRCDCQPRTMSELEEAAKQEKAIAEKKP